MASLVICEKPSVAKDIAGALNVNRKNNGYYENNNYIITWAMGHLVTLAAPERYDHKFKSWDMDDLPILPKELKYDILPKTSKQFNIIKSLIHNSKVQNIIIATDAGREGELVARLILLKATNKKPIKRLWISSVTKKAIISGFNDLKSGSLYEGLFMSALARSYADWVVGINSSRALTTKYNASLSCGRVQTPTLQLIYNQELNVKKFVPKKYYLLKLKCNDIIFKLETTKQFDLNYISEVKNSINNFQELIVSDIVKKQVSEQPKQLYDLTQLQIEANLRFGFSPKQTLDIIQSLYEYHKVLTYPRTDSRYLTSDMKSTINERIKASNRYGFDVLILDSKIMNNKCFNNDKVSDHHAIIPTETSSKLCKFSENEDKIYKMVVIRFLQIFMNPSISENISVKCNLNGHTFSSNTSIIIDQGFKSIENIKSNNYIQLSKERSLKIDNIYIDEEYTKSPSLLNEATLIDAMENPFKYVELDKEYNNILKEAKGIGTVATRADIIEKLFNSFLIEKNGSGIITTSKGIQLLELVPSDLKSPLLTAKWEKQLTDISSNKLKFDVFRKQIDDYSIKLINEIKNDNKQYIHDNISTIDCPKCSKKMLKVKNKTGDELLVCSNSECKYKIKTKSLTKIQCPDCRKKMFKIYNETGDLLVCNRCGFRKKERDFFDKPKKNEASKVEIKQYMNTFTHDEDNSPFAALLEMFDDK